MDGVVRKTVRFGLADQIEFLNLVRPPSCLACVVLAKRGRKEEEERRKKEEEGKEDGGSAIQRTKLSSRLARSGQDFGGEKKKLLKDSLTRLLTLTERRKHCRRTKRKKSTANSAWTVTSPLRFQMRFGPITNELHKGEEELEPTADSDPRSPSLHGASALRGRDERGGVRVGTYKERREVIDSRIGKPFFFSWSWNVCRFPRIFISRIFRKKF